MEPTSADPAASLILKLRPPGSKIKAWNNIEVGNIIAQKNMLVERIDYLDTEEEDRTLVPTEAKERVQLKIQQDRVLAEEE